MTDTIQPSTLPSRDALREKVAAAMAERGVTNPWLAADIAMWVMGSVATAASATGYEQGFAAASEEFSAELAKLDHYKRLAAERGAKQDELDLLEQERDNALHAAEH